MEQQSKTIDEIYDLLAWLQEIQRTEHFRVLQRVLHDDIKNEENKQQMPPILWDDEGGQPTLPGVKI